METVYLGLFSSIFKAIFDAILKPVIDFLGGIINKVFTWIFDVILKPLLVDVLLPLFKWLIQLIYEVLAGLLYSIMAELLHLIDLIQVVFNVFAGIQPVNYDGNRYYMLELLFSRDMIQKGTWVLIFVSILLMIGFSIMAVMRSMADLSGEMKNPVSKVMRLTFTAFLRLVTIPIVCMFLITLSGRILISVTDGINYAQSSTKEGDEGKNTRTTLARAIFCMSTLDAAKNDSYNVSTNSNAGINDDLRAAYYYSDYSGTAKDYYDSGQVESDFTFHKMNFIVGLGVGILFLKILITCCFKFINRMFNVLLLYLSSPLFVSTMPLDEGKHYNQWKDMFVGQLFSGYGSVIAMQLYLIIAPGILSGNITFMNSTTEGDMVVRLVFIIGGAFAIENAGSMITGLISSTAASMESAQEREAAGLMDAGKALATTVGKTLKSRLGKGGGKQEGGAGNKDALKKSLEGGGKEGDEKDGEGGGKEGDGKEKDSNKFDGKKSGKTGSGSKFEGGKNPSAGSGSAQVTESAKKMEASKNASKPAAKPNTKGEAEQDEQEEEDAATPAATNKSGGKKGASNKGGAGAAPKKSKNVAGKNRHKVTSSWFGGMLVLGRDKDGKRKIGLNLGSKFNFGLKKDGSVGGNVFGLASWKKDTDGNTSRSLLGGAYKWGTNADGTKNRSLLGGFKWNVDKEGNTSKVSVPFMRFKSVDDGSGNKVMKLSKVKIAEGLQFKRAFYTDSETGKLKTEMYCSEFSALSFAGMTIKQRYDADTGKIEKLATMTGDHFARVKDEKTGKVEYVKTHSDFLGRTKVYDRDNAGKYHVVATKGWVSSESYLLNKETGETTLQKSVLNSGMSLYEDTEAMEGIQPKKVSPSKPLEDLQGPTIPEMPQPQVNIKSPEAPEFSVNSGPAFSVDHGTFKAESHPQPQVNTTAPEMPQKPEIPQPQVTISNGPSYSVNSGVFRQETHNGNGPEAPKTEIPKNNEAPQGDKNGRNEGSGKKK